MAAPSFSGALLDRAASRRGDRRWLDERLADPLTEVVIVTDGGVLLAAGDEPAPALVSAVELDGRTELLLLGVADGRALFAAGVDTDAAAGLAPGARAASLRDAATLVSQADGALLAYAQALVGWHRRHPFCSVCGAATEIREAGHVRGCPRCGAIHHPRTDPVVIALVSDGERALLGRQAAWPPGRYSALAGFVEPGESLEEAVAREVREEASVEVVDVRYDSSQPWPFPASLMLGFHARHAGGAAAIGDAELEDVRWFEREELHVAARGEGKTALPPPQAIARRLIDSWLRETHP